MDKRETLMTIELSELGLLGSVGVSDEERSNLQPLSFDVRVELASIPESDDIASSYDYTLIVDTVSRVVMRTQHRLLETLSVSIVSALLEDPKLISAQVTVKKMRPPVEAHLAFAAVTYFREKR